MNESMLTGETTPIVKSSLPSTDTKFEPDGDQKNCMIYAGNIFSILCSFILGTRCIETQYYNKGKFPILGLVYQTGFNTAKGNLIRSIMYPQSHNFNFYLDALKFICVMALFSSFGVVYNILVMIDHNPSTKDMVVNCLDLITITVPPALPACMSIGISLALARLVITMHTVYIFIRLKKKGIYSIFPDKINISGKINIMCFDKTGTLTEEGLEMFGVRPICYDSSKVNRFLVA